MLGHLKFLAKMPGSTEISSHTICLWQTYQDTGRLDYSHFHNELSGIPDVHGMIGSQNKKEHEMSSSQPTFEQ